MKKLLCILISTNTCFLSFGQYNGFYPPHTKWYQDPLGFRPLELSSATGFAFGAAAMVGTLLLTKKSSHLPFKRFIFTEGGVGLAYKPPYHQAFQQNTGLLLQVRNKMALGLEINMLYFKSRQSSNIAIGTRPFARWYLCEKNGLRLFAEYGGGISLSEHRFPLSGTGWDADTARSGTRFNFTSKYGLGTEIKVGNKLFLHAGVRHFHLSNGNIKGIQRNPSHDSNGFFVGLLTSLEDRHRAK